MTKWRSIIGVIAIFMCLSNTAHADFYSVIRKFTVDTIELEVRVETTQGQPLPGAVLWYIANPMNKRDGYSILKADVQRMVSRYANQGDFLETNDVLKAVFERTDLQGRFYDIGRGSSGSHYPYILVATKRGYLPQVIEGAAPLNRRHVVQFKLMPDPSAQVERRMERFDQIMGEARSNSPDQDYMGETRMHRLEALQTELRQLAQSLEQDGLNDDASAVYWALADFPSVTRIIGANGQPQIVGYANGRTGDAAEADRLKAAMLNTKVSKLLIDKMMVQQGFLREGIKTAEHGLAYLAAFEQLAAGVGEEHILPWEYRVAIRQAIRWSTPEKSCGLLNRAYVFEPTIMKLEDWWLQLKDVERQRVRMNLPISSCEIAGLPKVIKN